MLLQLLFLCPSFVLPTETETSASFTASCSPSCSLQNGAQSSSSVRVSASWRGGDGDQRPYGWGGGELGPGDESPSRVD